MSFNRRVALLLCLGLLTLLGGCNAARTTSAQTATPRKELPSFYYVFAHQYLPRTLHAQPQLGLALALHKDNRGLLQSMWDHCRENTPELEKKNAPPTGLTVEGGTIAANTALAVITMPKPQTTPEAYYACVITTFTTDSAGELHAQNIAYYTLEKSISFSLDAKKAAGQAKAEPTVIGAWDKEHAHLNYGSGPAPEARDAFIAAALKIYAGKAKLCASSSAN